MNRVKTTTTTTGTGNITVSAGAAARCAPLSSIASGKQVAIVIEDESGTDWELSLCTILTATTFSRDTVLNGSAGAGNKVNFGVGTKTVFVTMDANGQTIADLPDGGAAQDNDIVEISRNGVSMRLTRAALVAGGSAPADTTAPTLSSPTGASTGTTTASGSVTTSEGNGTLYFLATVNATETAATVKASGATQAINSTGSKAVSVTGLSANTTYYLHFVHRDAGGNDSARVSSTSFTTSAAGDTTAPTLSSPTGTQTGETTATGSVSTNEANGTLYRYISTNAVESVSTVKAANLTSAVAATGAQAVNATGLTANTTYYWHFVHRDAAGNDSVVANSAAFTTAAAAGTNYNIIGYGGVQGPPASVNAASSQVYGTKKLAIEKPGAYYTFSPAPASAVSGWGTSNTVPPATLADPNTNYNGANSVNGMVPMGAYDGTSFRDMSSYWPTVGAGTVTVYLWIKPVDGQAYCFNPSGTVVSNI